MDISVFQQQMQKALDHLEKELKGLQMGRASTGLVENIDVEMSYGGQMKIPQVGHVSLMDGQTLKVEPWDKNELKNIEKAIYDANTGLTPQNQGSYIMIKIPALTQERRMDIVKQVKAMGEDIKGRVRMVRQDAMKETKRIFDAKEIGEDMHKANEKEIDAVVKTMNEKIDTMVKSKSEDVMIV